MGQRHAEVVNLLTGTIDQIEALPDEKRQTYEPYYTSWWTAVVSPELQWGGQSKGTAIISREHLSLLNGVGDVIEARMDHTPSAPGAFNLEQVGTQCAEWLQALQEQGSLPDSFRRSLIQAITHVQWLIENVALFGVARVAKAANTVTGEVIQAIPHVRKDLRRSWAVRLGTWTATLMAFSAFNTATADAIESTDRLVTVIADAAVQVVDSIEQANDEGPPEIEHKPKS